MPLWNERLFWYSSELWRPLSGLGNRPQRKAGCSQSRLSSSWVPLQAVGTHKLDGIWKEHIILEKGSKPGFLERSSNDDGRFLKNRQDLDGESG